MTVFKNFYNVSRVDSFRIVPIGCTHCGNAAAEEHEPQLKKLIAEIVADESAYTILMGDACLSDDMEMLTTNGWKSFETLRKDDLAITYNPETKTCAPGEIINVWVNETPKSMIHVRSGFADALVTKSHRMLVNRYSMMSNTWGEDSVVQAEKLLEGKTKFLWRMPVACKNWTGIPTDISPDWFSLRGWIDSEGSVEKRGNSERIQISQSEKVNPVYTAKIEQLIRKLELTPHKSKRRDGVVLWRFSASDTRNIHNTIGRKGEYTPWIMNSPREHLQAYLDALMDGDGTWSRLTFTQVAERNFGIVDIFQELCFKLGYRARVAPRKKTSASPWGGLCCYFGKDRGEHALVRYVDEVSTENVAYTWCVTTDTGFIVVRRNNKIFIIGNCEFINVQDKRFDADALASWITVPNLNDLAKVQIDYYLELVRPLAVAGKILAVVSGNHEEAIKRYSERDVYSEIVSAIKGWQGMNASEQLGVGMTGWLLLKFMGGERGDRKGSKAIKINLHHGFVGGRLDGAKALNMQRWLWSHDALVAMMGHSHDIKVLPGAIEKLNVRNGKVEIQSRIGLVTGNWLGRAAYATAQGYLPLPIGYTELKLWPRTLGMKKMSGSAIVL